MFELQAMLGPANASEATLYLRPIQSADAPARASLTLSGTLRGPRCQFAKTLPAEFKIVDLGREPNWLAKVDIMEPCFWTPELPFQYDLTLKVRGGEQIVWQDRKTTGLRRIGLAGRNVMLDGRRWVFRGWRRPDAGISTELLTECREAGVGLVLEDPAEDLLRAAAALGVPLCVDAKRAEIATACSLSPAVLFEFREAAGDGPSGGAVGVVKYAVDRVAAGNPRAILWREVEHAAGTIAKAPYAAFAYGPAGPIESAQEARAACERLQRDLAPQTDLAGYVV